MRWTSAAAAAKSQPQSFGAAHCLVAKVFGAMLRLWSQSSAELAERFEKEGTLACGPARRSL